MIERKLLLFNTKQEFESALRSNLVYNDAIAFIKDPKLIWTHGEYWKGYTDKVEIDYDNLLTNNATIGIINGKEFSVGDNINIKEGVDYTAGLGIIVNGTTVLLKVATKDEIGGLKTGYVQNGNNYPVRLDNEGNAYVNVPAVQISPIDGVDGGYTQFIFKTVITSEVPSLPYNYDISPEGWSSSAVKSSSTGSIWMASRFVSGNGAKGEWQGPWKISGEDGRNGIDGDYLEFIYTRTKTEDINAVTKIGKTAALDSQNNPADDKFIPFGWTDHPEGVDKTYRFEWMSVRRKTHSAQNVSGTWSSFSTPALWSSYGVQGMDGDGVQYIFYAGYNYPDREPSTWTTLPDFLTGNMPNGEFILEGSGWSDDPVDLSIYGSGAKQWVSTRKYRNGEWGAYSAPALWSYYAKDGDAGVGIIADFENSTMFVPLKASGKNYKFEQTATLHMYDGVNEIDGFKTSIERVTDSRGNSIVQLYGNTAKFSLDEKNVKVSLDDDAFNLEQSGTITVIVKATATIRNSTVERFAAIQIIGMQVGTDGITYQLMTSSRVIKRQEDGTVDPKNIKVSCKIARGLNLKEINYSPEETKGFSLALFGDGSYLKFKYQIDDGQEQDLKVLEISTANINNCLRVELDYVKDEIDYLIDQEEIYVVSDGVTPEAPEVESYEIIITKTNLYKDTPSYKKPNMYDNELGSYTKINSVGFKGSVTYKIIYVKGNSRQEINLLQSMRLGIHTYLKIGDILQIDSTYTEDGWVATIPDNTRWDESYVSTLIYLDIHNTTVKTQPVPIKMGDVVYITEESSDSYIPGVVLRVRNWVKPIKPAWNNGTVEENNIKYQDIAIHANSYYLCKQAGTELEPGMDENQTDWKMFSATPAMMAEYLMANNAFINNLAAGLVIVTKEYKTDGVTTSIPVAGMVSGSGLPLSLLNAGYKSTNDGGIRIFAGKVPDSKKLDDTAFNVNNDGRVSASNGAVIFNEDGSGQLANGKISWNTDGSGAVAGGKISWNTDGDVTINGAIIRADNSGFAFSDDVQKSLLNRIEISDVYYLPAWHVDVTSPALRFSYSIYKNGILCYRRYLTIIYLDSGSAAMPTAFGDPMSAYGVIYTIIAREILKQVDTLGYVNIQDSTKFTITWPMSNWMIDYKDGEYRRLIHTDDMWLKYFNPQTNKDLYLFYGTGNLQKTAGEIRNYPV